MRALLALCAAILCAGAVDATAAPSPDPAAALRARHAALKESLDHNQFRRPVHMDSHEGTNRIMGEIYAVVSSPFAVADAALSKPSHWCDILTLHVNTKYCKPSSGSAETVLHVRIGNKASQPIDDAYPVDFVYSVSARSADYLQVELGAQTGPFGTSGYRIVLEAIPTRDGRTFMHLSYSYSYGPMAQIAMQFYLATIARHKVGFSVVGAEPGGAPLHVAGMRGVVERNTMRYYLAVEAYLGAWPLAGEARVEKALLAWFASIEGYPLQLHELEEGEYLALKRSEFSRQR